MSAWRGQEQHILFVTSGGFQAELTTLAYLKEDVADSPAVRDRVVVCICRTTTTAATTTTTTTTTITVKKKVTKAQKWNRV